MRNLRVLASSLLCTCLIALAAVSQETSVIVHLKDGSQVTGTLVQLIPDTSVSVRTSDGTLYVLDWSRVQTIEQTQGAPPLQKKTSAWSFGVESWYMYWSLGYSSSTYPASLQTVIDNAAGKDPNHTSIAIDMLGFYWPLRNERTLLGFVATGPGDRYTNTGVSFQINQYILGASVMHFLHGIPGDGFFARADAGIAALSSELHPKSLSGTGIKLSAGYGIPIDEEIRILLHAGYAYRSFESEDYTTLSVCVGALF